MFVLKATSHYQLNHHTPVNKCQLLLWVFFPACSGQMGPHQYSSRHKMDLPPAWPVYCEPTVFTWEEDGNHFVHSAFFFNKKGWAANTSPSPLGDGIEVTFLRPTIWHGLSELFFKVGVWMWVCMCVCSRVYHLGRRDVYVSKHTGLLRGSPSYFSEFEFI